MPQMSSMSQTSLFMMFTACLIIVMVMIYFYIYKMNLKVNSQNITTNNKIWKW